MVKLSGIFSKFKSKKILLFGDFMLDEYTIGSINRISPEAPVPVLHVKQDRSQPGGAGNVALNMLALKAEVISVGRIGKDFAGRELIKSLQLSGCNTQNLLFEDSYITPTKNRLIANSQQLLRVDREDIIPLSSKLEKKIIDKLPSLLQNIDIVALSDYGKGFLTRSIIKEIIEIFKISKIPVIVDPKGSDFSKYKNAFMIKPNLSEAYLAANLPKSETLEKVAEKIFSLTDVEYLLITRAEEGITLFNRKINREDFPVRSREVQDVTGAGDTVLALLSVCLANNFEMNSAISFANIAAGIAIEQLGCARVTLFDLAKRLLELDMDNKIFDESHLFALEEVLKERKFNLLQVDSSKGMSQSVIKAILTLSEKRDHQLVVSIVDDEPSDDFISILSSLKNVDYIILKKNSVQALCQKLDIKKIYSLLEDRLEQINFC